MWKRKRGRSPHDGAVRDMLVRALRDLAGTARGVVYDVPRAERPRMRSGSPVYADGGRAWDRYLRARRALDDGRLTLLLSLRPLSEDERRLAAGWGAAHANTFLLVEPLDAACDLTDARSPLAREVFALCEGALASAPDAAVDARERWTARTPLGERLRGLYGRWVCWDEPLPYGRTHELPLPLAGPEDTLWDQLAPLLHERFPQRAFDAALAELRRHERELFGGTVASARSAFRTRLGLPILHDQRAPDRAVRRLVNRGEMTVASGLPRRLVFGPGRRVPDDMPDDEFERLLMT